MLKSPRENEKTALLASYTKMFRGEEFPQNKGYNIFRFHLKTA